MPPLKPMEWQAQGKVRPEFTVHHYRVYRMLWILAEEQAFQDTQPEPLDFNYMIREWEEKWQGVGEPMARPSPEMERDASGMQAWIIDKGGGCQGIPPGHHKDLQSRVLENEQVNFPLGIYTTEKGKKQELRRCDAEATNMRWRGWAESMSGVGQKLNPSFAGRNGKKRLKNSQKIHTHLAQPWCSESICIRITLKGNHHLHFLPPYIQHPPNTPNR